MQELAWWVPLTRKRGGWPPFEISASAIPVEDAPSLRFLQGWAALLRALFDLLRRRDQTHSVHAFPTPALAKNARAGHPQRWLMPARSKARATRPSSVLSAWGVPANEL
jgi:hypothetical protein